MDDLEHLEVLEGVQELNGEPSNQIMVESLHIRNMIMANSE